MLDRLPFYGQVLVFSFLSLAIVGAAYYVYPNLSEKRVSIASLESDLDVKQRQIREGQAIETRLPEFEKDVENLQMQLRDVQQILPTDQETGDLLKWIKNQGDQSNLDLKSFSPGSLRPVEFYKEFPIEMQVIGRYHDLGVFLDRVSKYQRIINVSNLRIASVRDAGKTIQANMTATTFVYSNEGGNAGSVQ